MAEQYVPIDRQEDAKKRRGILPLIILLLIILLGLWFFLMRDSDNNDADKKNNASQSSQQSSTKATSITDLDTLLNAKTPADNIGKTVNITQAPVYTVIGDKSFTIGTADKYVYVLLSDQLNSANTEQAVQVKAGETRAIQGKVVEVPSDMQTINTQFQLDETQAQQLKTQGYYIEVQNTNEQ